MINQPKRLVKTYADTYIYGTYHDYDKKLFNFIMRNDEVNKKSDDFKDAIFEIKRRNVPLFFIKAMESNNVIFLHGDVPKAFSVFTAKDLKHRPAKESFGEEASVIPYRSSYTLNEEVATTTPLKVFVAVDHNRVFDEKGVLREPEILISRLNEVAVNMVYYKMPDSIFNNFGVVNPVAAAFTKLFIHITDYIAKVSVMGNTKAKVEYAAHKYFYHNLAQMKSDLTTKNRVEERAQAYCKLSDREVAIVNASIQDEDYTNIKTFIQSIASMIRMDDFTIDTFVEKWMWMYGGQQTAFALEYFPALSGMLTDAYHGCYINNQKTISKVCGQSMVEYTKQINDRVDTLG